MTKRTTALLAAGVILAALFAGGCAGAIHPHTPRISPTGVTYAGPLTKSVVFADTGYTFRPPGTQVAAISADTVCTQHGACLPGAATMYLALATTDGVGTIKPGDTMTRTIVDRLVYVTMWKNYPSTSSGGPAVPSGVSPPPFRAYNCLAFVLVDAKTEERLKMTLTGDTNDINIANVMN